MFNLFNLLPREEKFYTLLSDLVLRSHKAAGLLHQLVNTTEPTAMAQVGLEISQAKLEGKRFFNIITSEVCRTFITPFDREDLLAFALDLYKILKVTEKIKESISRHQLTLYQDDFNREIVLIMEQAEVMQRIVQLLAEHRNSKSISEQVEKLLEIEEKGDAVTWELMTNLFRDVTDTRELVLRKDLYEMMDDVLDYYRNAGNVALQIVLKHS